MINRRKCPICNNGIREEMQYAHMNVKNKFFLIDAEEYECFERAMQDQIAEFEKIEPEENKPSILVYGVLIPQSNSKIERTEWTEKMQKYKGYAFSNLNDNKEYISCYEDICLYENDVLYVNHIPCAVLLQTEIDFEKRKDFGFGYTLFLRYQDMDVLENVLNRDYIFSLRDIEESYQGDTANWMTYINEEKLKHTAHELF